MKSTKCAISKNYNQNLIYLKFFEVYEDSLNGIKNSNSIKISYENDEKNQKSYSTSQLTTALNESSKQAPRVLAKSKSDYKSLNFNLNDSKSNRLTTSKLYNDNILLNNLARDEPNSSQTSSLLIKTSSRKSLEKIDENFSCVELDEIPIKIERNNETCVIINSNRSSSISKKVEKIKKTDPVSDSTLRMNKNNNNNNSSDYYESDNKLVPIDMVLIKILNRFIFILFLVFIVCLNVFSLLILPYFVKPSLSIDD